MIKSVEVEAMVDVCFYFQVHQPIRLAKYSVFDIGKKSRYWDDKKNKEVMEKVARKCYLPTNTLIHDLVKQGKMKAAYSITGTAIEQFEEYAPHVLHSFQELADSGGVEFLGETYYHSLSYLFSKNEFREQVRKHEKLIKKHFGQKPKVFRNTELIFNNELGKYIEDMGYKGMIAEGASHILGWRSPNFVYKSVGSEKMKLLLKNYKLSDDIAFRFSDKGWKDHPLSCEKFAKWCDMAEGDSINLFMDYETFGEHQWADTGIFNFLKGLPDALSHKGIGFKLPSEVLESDAKDTVDYHNFVSWADVERDVSAWMGNKIQDSALEHLYKMEKMVKKSKDKTLVNDWRKLTTSDHFYYMCTKWFNDGDVHKYFNPYDSPYEGYIAFMNVLQDMKVRLEKKETSSVLSKMPLVKGSSTNI